MRALVTGGTGRIGSAVADRLRVAGWSVLAAGRADGDVARRAQAMLTRVFARALAPEVRVCGIAPGAVAVSPEQEERRAAETLLGRIGRPEDVAEAVVFLTGASFVTGASLVVDGGRLLQSGAA